VERGVCPIADLNRDMVTIDSLYKLVIACIIADSIRRTV